MLQTQRSGSRVPKHSARIIERTTGFILSGAGLLLILVFYMLQNQSPGAAVLPAVFSEIYAGSVLFFGLGAEAYPVFCLAAGVILIIDRDRLSVHAVPGVILIFIAYLGAQQIRMLPAASGTLADYLSASAGTGSGIAGAYLVWFLWKATGRIGSLLIFFLCFCAGVVFLAVTPREALSEGKRLLREGFTGELQPGTDERKNQ